MPRFVLRIYIKKTTEINFWISFLQNVKQEAYPKCEFVPIEVRNWKFLYLNSTGLVFVNWMWGTLAWQLFDTVREKIITSVGGGYIFLLLHSSTASWYPSSESKFQEVPACHLSQYRDKSELHSASWRVGMASTGIGLTVHTTSCDKLVFARLVLFESGFKLPWIPGF